MFLAHKDHPATYEAVLHTKVFQEALAWIEKNAKNLPDGEHEIRGREMYANIHTAEPLPREQCVFEAHKNYLDLHFCLEGGEVIEWAPVQTLKPRIEYDATKDYTLFDLPAQATACVMTPGAFAIFLPEDSHMPKMSDGHNKKVRKVVVKIKMDLLR